jgi:hypothetical protein
MRTTQLNMTAAAMPQSTNAVGSGTMIDLIPVPLELTRTDGEFIVDQTRHSDSCRV